MSSHKSAPEVFDGVSTNDVPSAGFGWSRTPRMGVQVAGWISVLVLLAYNFGNHRGHVETIWLFALAIVISLGLLLHLFQPKLSQVRAITSHNKPVGHVEPDWVYDQKTVSGAYAELSDRELRSLNIDPARLARTRAASPAGVNQGISAAPTHTPAPTPGHTTTASDSTALR